MSSPSSRERSIPATEAEALDQATNRRRFCCLSAALLVVPALPSLPGHTGAPRIVIRDGWILLEDDLQ